MIEGIYGFINEYRWLSNFAPCEVEYNGKIYPSVENAYVAAKSLSEDFQTTMQFVTPSKAKQEGKQIQVRKDWDEIKIFVMRDLLRQKFKNEEYRKLLLDTGELYIEETNWWKDTFWGVCDGVGRNVLGNLIMEIRKELRDGKLS